MLRHFRHALKSVETALTMLASVLVLAAIGVLGAAAFYDRQARAAANVEQGTTTERPPSELQPRPDAVLEIKGVVISGPLSGDVSSSAKVAIIEYSDFQCPYCGRYAREVYPSLHRDYVERGLVSYSFRHFPLKDIHPSAEIAARAAECARAQGEFWRMHDTLFANQRPFDRESLVRDAATLGLNRTVFQRCLLADSMDAINRDRTEASRLGVRSTPTFFVGLVQTSGEIVVVRKISGAQPLEVFRRTIDDLLKSPAAS